MVKEIGYAYPSSAFGGKNGCYFVALKKDEHAPTKAKEIAHKFMTMTEAKIYAESLAMPYGRWSK